jgi:hypothetical protein
MTLDGSLARLAQFQVLRPVFEAATRLYVQFRPFVLHVDEPADGVIAKKATTIQGWYLTRAADQQIWLQLAGVPLTSVPVERMDAKPLFGRYVQGFRAIADLDAIALARPGLASDSKLELVSNGEVVASKPLRLLACDAASAQASAEKRMRKRKWLQCHSACPKCESTNGTLEFTGAEVRCRVCGASFEDNGYVLNFLPDDFRREFNIAGWDDISAHDYDEVARELIESVRAGGGKVLDCGSGLRPEVDETVICLEVYRFPNVDVLAVNQKLPFQNATFDAVLSLNVLEHVTDPFACAAELIRVLKPGGTLYCCMPFLQPEHGYPDHYFNATRSGLKQLFTRELELVRHFVPASGEPVWTLHWFLSWYLRELPAS